MLFINNYFYAFQQSHFSLALAKYKKVNDLIESEKNIEEPDKKKKREELVLAANLNMALVYLKQVSITIKR